MLAGGIGWGKHEDALKDVPTKETASLFWVVITTALEWEVPQYLL